MDKQATLGRVKEYRLLAVIRGPSPELTLKMVDALVAGGVRGIEITYSTPKAPEVVQALAKQYGEEILLGMGTLTEPAQAEEACLAGAHFLVSPVCSPTLVKAMIDTGLLVMPGAFTPTEVFETYRLGADIIKIFPGSIAGPDYLKALHGPLPYIPMMPTGGVSVHNVKEWFAAGAVAVGAGGELAPRALAEAGNWDAITANARALVEAVASAQAKK